MNEFQLNKITYRILISEYVDSIRDVSNLCRRVEQITYNQSFHVLDPEDKIREHRNHLERLRNSELLSDKENELYKNCLIEYNEYHTTEKLIETINLLSDHVERLKFCIDKMELYKNEIFLNLFN